MKISCSLDIISTPEVVFRWLGNPEQAKVWMTSVTKTEILHETPDLVGTTFRETVEDDSGAMDMQGVITACIPNKLISFHLESRVNIVDVEYRIEETHTGVRLIENAQVRWKFPVNIFSLFMGDKIRQGILAQTQKEFDKLKELAEADNADANM